MAEDNKLHTITPYLIIRNAAEAIKFYKQAFNATELFAMRFPGTNKILHAQLIIGDSQLMLSEEMPEMNELSKGPELLGGSPVTIHLYCDDVDQTFKRAVDAGATVIMELMNTFWGDRYGRIQDPFGHHWSLAQPVEDVSPEEMNNRAEEIFGGENPPGC
ncbi:MAG: VOC family protein [Planctomycetaceae bacterium]